MAESNSLLDLLLSANGRITRKTLWLKVWLPYVVIYLMAVVIDMLAGTFSEEFGIGLFSGVLSVCSIYPFVIVCIKRLHDRNRSGWFYLLCLVPILNLWPAVEIYFLRGTRGPNRFGPDPLLR